MSEANATVKLEKWIYHQLSTDAQLIAIVGSRIYRTVPTEPTAPFVHYFMRPNSSYVQGLGTVRSLTLARYAVKLVTDGEPSDAELVALDRFDELIGRQSNAVLNGFVFSGRGESPIPPYSEPRSGGNHSSYFYHQGSIYRIDTCPTP